MKAGVFLIFPILFLSLIIFCIVFIKNSTKDITQITSSSDFPIFTDYIVITETPIPTSTPRPTLTPTVTPIKISSSELEELFTRYANKESIDREKLKSIALCESGFNTYARNGIYAGLFQFSESSWINTRRAMSLNTDPDLRYIPQEAIKTAAFKIAIDGIRAWPQCSKK